MEQNDMASLQQVQQEAQQHVQRLEQQLEQVQNQLEVGDQLRSTCSNWYSQLQSHGTLIESQVLVNSVWLNAVSIQSDHGSQDHVN